MMEKNETKKPNKKIVAGGLLLAAIVIAFAAIFLIFREKPVTGSKNIVIDVVDQTNGTTHYELRTEAQYLRQAMEETEGLTFSGTESEYGMMVEIVNGERAVYAQDNAYWSFYVNDDYCSYGIDTQPVEDGDHFRIVYTLNSAQ